MLTLVLTRHGLTTRSHPEQHLGQTIDVPLSDEGRTQAIALAERLGPIAFERIVSSPLLRARETGEELARATGSAAEPSERLAPGATASDVRAAIASRGARVVVVGHQPDCGRIAAELTGGEESRLPAAGMVVIDLPG